MVGPPSSWSLQDQERRPTWIGYWPVSAAAPYPSPLSGDLLDALWLRLQADRFNGIATAIFVLAVLHTFVAARFIEAAHRLQKLRKCSTVSARARPVGARGRYRGCDLLPET